jgi:hypothetical protein
LQYALFDAAASTAASQLPIDNNGWQATDALFGCTPGDLLLMHVVDVNFVFFASQFFHSVNGIFASLATCTENFYLVFHPILPFKNAFNQSVLKCHEPGRSCMWHAPAKNSKAKQQSSRCQEAQETSVYSLTPSFCTFIKARKDRAIS